MRCLLSPSKARSKLLTQRDRRTGCELVDLLYRITRQVARLDRFAALMTRVGLVVTLWIGGLKVTHYAADRSVFFVANSPFLCWPLKTPDCYQHHRIAGGAFDAASMSWHHASGTDQLSLMLGAIIVTVGVLIALGFHYPAAGVTGGVLLTGMSLVILSILITTPEVWIPAHGAAFVVSDTIMLGASLWCAADSAKQFVVKRAGPIEESTLISYWGL